MRLQIRGRDGVPPDLSRPTPASTRVSRVLTYILGSNRLYGSVLMRSPRWLSMVHFRSRRRGGLLIFVGTDAKALFILNPAAPSVSEAADHLLQTAAVSSPGLRSPGAFYAPHHPPDRICQARRAQ